MITPVRKKLPHAKVRLGSKSALLTSRKWKRNVGQPVCRLGDGQQIVIHRAGIWFVLEEKPFFASFDVERRGSIAETVASWLIHRVQDAA